MTSEMEAAFEAVHDQPPNDLVAEILRDLDRDAGSSISALRDLEDDDVALSRAVTERDRPFIKAGIQMLDELNPQELTNRALLKVDAAIGELRDQVAELKRKPPKPPRTGAGARMNPDDIRLARGVLAGTAAFGAAAFVVSFGGQLAMAPYTQLQPALYWFVPFVIEAPIILLSFMIAVFRRRKQSTAMPWVIVLALTALSSAINGLHVYIESDGLPTPGDVAGAVVMALAPWLVLLLFEEFVRLAVRPTVEHPEAPAAAPAARKAPTRNRKATK